MGFIMYFLQIDTAYFHHILPNSPTYLLPSLHPLLLSLWFALYFMIPSPLVSTMRENT